MRYYDPGEVAVILHVKPYLIYQYISENKIKSIRMGANYRIPEDELELFKNRYFNKKMA